jgi:hypothetical protein
MDGKIGFGIVGKIPAHSPHRQPWIHIAGNKPVTAEYKSEKAKQLTEKKKNIKPLAFGSGKIL